jgi:hypothetical protein
LKKDLLLLEILQGILPSQLRPWSLRMRMRMKNEKKKD